MKYRFAIDETGSFSMSENDKSFVCGVLISQNEQSVKEKYRKAYIECGYGDSAPNKIESLIGDENKKFHYSETTDSKKKILKTNLLPLIDKIFVSSGKPILYANNQNWWLVAVNVVIEECLKKELKEGDELEILIDNRADKVWGLLEEDKSNVTFNDYHKILQQQIENSLNLKNYKNKINIKFSSDTRSVYVNLADITCGFVRQDKKNIYQEIVKCYCSKFMNGDDPIKFIDKNPMLSLSLIFQEISNAELKHVDLIKKILEKIERNTDTYSDVWDMFYNLIKAKIKERESDSSLVTLHPFVEIFLKELKQELLHKNTVISKSLELIILITEYYSHIGEIEPPFDNKDFLELIKSNKESRLIRKWENYVSYSLRKAQIIFNAYNFENIKDDFEKLLDKQDTIIKNISFFNDNTDKEYKDEPTTAIIGTLAQVYAYQGELEKAIEYFELSKEYAISTSSVTDSYLFTLYHRMQNVKKTRECFENQIGKSPEDYFSAKDFTKNWELLSYCKLRALELYKNHTTRLPHVNLQKLKNYNTEYPFPLIQKWEGVALWLEDKEKNKPIIEKYFTDAITNLQRERQGFAINTLALSIIQCFALVNNQNPFHRIYNTCVLELSKRSKHFANYIKDKQLLNDIKNDADIWQRAIALPFIYS